MATGLSTKSNDELVGAIKALTDALEATSANTACLAVEMVGLDERLKDLNEGISSLGNSVELLSREMCLLRFNVAASEEPAP